jgi:putative nucleotidyltransferase with HDIG domain
MAVQLERVLHSTVARRMALSFIGCALVPLAALALVTTIHTETELDTQARAQLHNELKQIGMDGLGQLILAESQLRVLAAALSILPETGDAASTQVQSIFGTPPIALAFLPDDGPSVALTGKLERPVLTGAQQAFLQQTGHVLALAETAGVATLVLMVPIDREGLTGQLAVAVDARRAFGLSGNTVLTAGADACVELDQRVLGCSAGAPEELTAQPLPDSADEGREITFARGRYLVQTRIVPLQAAFGAGAIRLVMVRPDTVVREPLHRFLRDFWLVAFLSALVVTWISLGQVRRQLSPLTALTNATRRMARRDFDRPVEIASRDEFEELGQAFNDVSSELKRQFADLEAFNLGTLSALARTVDAKSPWTAGHSERVTALAVALARELGMPDDDITDLRRGGLIHDIGKLATPPDILDKTGRLTDEEIAVMREHVTRGVHILEPIPAFARLLPIVAQHHEHWNGGGYPAGLAGTAIARTARVLAVADVFDGLRSDRPYRAGLPMAEVIARIVAGSGTHFDPAVVDALTALTSRGSPWRS